MDNKTDDRQQTNFDQKSFLEMNKKGFVSALSDFAALSYPQIRPNAFSLGEGSRYTEKHLNNITYAVKCS